MAQVATKDQAVKLDSAHAAAPSGAIDKAQPSAHSSAADGGMSTWAATLCWSGFIVVWYLMLQQAITGMTDSSAQAQMFDWVPRSAYMYSEAAFMTATLLNAINFVFEDTPAKQQLALLSCIIKGLSWHCDHLIVAGKAAVKIDYHGVILLPSRYVQWSCSTPTMILALSRISDLSTREVVLTMLADWLMIVMGYVAAELSWFWAAPALALSFVCWGYVLWQLANIFNSAARESRSPHSRRSLRFTLSLSYVVWSVFPAGWVLQRLPFKHAAALGEPLLIIANFMAKVMFSTSVMYNNYVTIAQRKREAQLEKEHQERLQAVKDLSAAGGRKDAFLAVVGHELRTPLNAVVQLSNALTMGAGGPLQDRAREWMGTISACARHLLGVVNDIITFRSTQASSMPLQQELIDVGSLVGEVLATLLPCARNGQVLEKVLHARLPPIVGDRRRLVQALSNLVGNAIKFTDNKPGGKVTVKAYPDKGARHVIIKVVDNGVGCTPEQLEALGQAYKHPQDLSSRKAGGLGLGLPITRQLAAAHGGSCSLSSPGPGKGAAAVLKLPVLQRYTDINLQPQFTSRYTSLGYNLSELLSPEVATAEGRPYCPTFTVLEPGTAVPAAAGAAQQQRGSGASFDGPAVPSVVLPPSGPLHMAMHPSGALPPHMAAASVGGGRGSSGNSFDLALSQGATVVAYRWPDEAADHHHDGGGLLGAAGQQQQQADGERLSDVALDAWEAYARTMGTSDTTSFSVPSGEMLHYAAGPNAIMMMGGGDNHSGRMYSSNASYGGFDQQQQLSGAMSAASGHLGSGLPGLAVALGSELYETAREPLPVMVEGKDGSSASSLKKSGSGKGGGGPAAGGGAGGGRPVAGLRGLAGRGQQRDSIEEDPEEEEAEGATVPPLPAVERSSSDVPPGVLTPSRSAQGPSRRSDVEDANGLMMSSGAGSNASGQLPASVEQVMAAAAQASSMLAAAAASGSNLSAGGSYAPRGFDSAGSSLDLPVPQQQQVVRAPSDWDAYVSGGAPDAGAAYRADAPEIVANNERLSLQYEAALAEAAAKHLPVNPDWHTWVARIPEHHKQAVAEAAAEAAAAATAQPGSAQAAP